MAALLTYRGAASWEGYYKNPAVLLALNIFPLIVGAGIIAGEVSSGRALLLHSLGASRKQFVVGRFAGVTAFCWGCMLVPHLLIASYVAWTGSGSSWGAAVSTALFAGLHSAYMNALLVALSVFVRSWGNAAVLLALQVTTAIVADLLVSSVSEDPAQWMRLARLLVAGPLRLIVESSTGALPAGKDVLIALAILFIYVSVAVFAYQRSEIGRLVGRE
ncbi:MAG: ABC transporter permease subunit [Acidobacteriales bacterium]|nr:ABC transporter permease subunit [Terriglobales bacterium]